MSRCAFEADLRWVKPGQYRTTVLLSEAAVVFGADCANQDCAEVAESMLEFYSSAKLVRFTCCSNDENKTKKEFALCIGNRFYPLTGTQTPILAVNTDERLELTTDTLPAYVRFFQAFVNQAPHHSGARLIETLEQLPNLPGVQLNSNRLKTQLHHVRVEGFDDDGAYIVHPILLMADNRLVRFKWQVFKNGRIAIMDEQKDLLEA